MPMTHKVPLANPWQAEGRTFGVPAWIEFERG